MSNPASSVAVVKDKVLPTAIDRIQSQARRLIESLRPAARAAAASPVATTVANAVGRAAPFVRANPLLALGVVFTGAGLILGLASIGSGVRTGTAEARP